MSVRLSIAIVLSLLPLAAFAHPGHETLGFLAGVLHPLTGVDHLIAMLAVGMWAAQLGGRARLLIPLTFLCAMMLGMMLVGENTQFSLEMLTAVSALMLVCAVIFRWRPAPMVASLLVIGFAAAHGWEHGTQAAGLNFMSGVLAASAALQCFGVWLGSRLSQQGTRGTA